ncbi:hypothetical protein [Novosphingobium sp. BL-52-GroH]|uniref:hypothetical protein n=1 Tax=Novosphingobium sp. BL-52-GroH TaxID=3349877 RepID=UPI00384ACADC
MERFVLFISEPGSDDIVDIHPSKPAAESALVDYVRARSATIGLPAHPDDDRAVASYFQNSEAIYAIARVMPLAKPGNDQ